jgi:hypothetical protein
MRGLGSNPIRLSSLSLLTVLSAASLVACGGGDPTRPHSMAAGGEASGGSTSVGGGVATGGNLATGGSVAGGSTSAGGSSGGTAGGSESAGGSAGATGGSGGGGEFIPDGTPPELEPGVWKEITPSQMNFEGNFGNVVISLDPSNTATLYLTADMNGLWKSVDAGSTWQRLGTPPDEPNFGTTTDYLDSPVAVSVDPDDSDHLYATQGVRGVTMGFWESSDGGETWAMPQGFLDISAEIATRDMTKLVVDPNDFDHVLVGSHSAWSGLSNAGILETTDGGDSFVKRMPETSWANGSLGIQFLYSPKYGVGDKNTWLVNTETEGSFWRTTNAGESWTHLDDSLSGFHGGAAVYYAKGGVVYSGATGAVLRSTDNGVNWATVSGLPFSYYITIMGDGNTMYTAPSYPSQGAPFNSPYYSSSEDDGQTWAAYQSGTQTFGNGPATMTFDEVGRILYSANWDTGCWALKVIDP